MNRHPVDRLADIRDELRLLNDEHDALRDSIIANGGAVGDEYVATIQQRTRRTLDKAKLAKHLGSLAAFETENTHSLVKLARRATRPRTDVFD